MESKSDATGLDSRVDVDGLSLEGSAPAEDGFSCAVCYDELGRDQLAVNPCCFAEGGSTKYCKGCITAICQRGIQSHIGRCPTCYTLITISSDGVVQTCRQVTGRCRACCQERVLVDSAQNRLCDKCLLGASFRFRYECQGCGKDQVIPHPMWLYQESPEAFGNVTWACHRDCHNFTNWRVHPEDAPQIPPEHCPESWGRREEWIEAVRAHRLDGAGHHSNDNETPACVIC